MVDAWIHTTSETVDALVSCPLPGTVSLSLAPSRIPSLPSPRYLYLHRRLRLRRRSVCRLVVLRSPS